MTKIKILIADDHGIVRQGTRNILEQEDDLEVVAEAVDGAEAVKMAIELSPDVAIIDIAMPNLDGIEATRQIRANCPDTSVLILSAYDDNQFIFSLLEAGAAGYLLKSVHSRELISAIRTVYTGESVLHPSIVSKVVSRFSATTGKPRGQEQAGILTSREMEILQLMTKGVSNKEIAEELHLSIRTVQGHLSQVFSKMNVGSRTEALTRALKEGWVNL